MSIVVLAMVTAGGVGVIGADTAAGGGDKGALYASVSAVVVAMIGGAVAVFTSRRPAEPPTARYVDAPTSNALPAAMAELYEHVRAELEDMTVDRDRWRRRAEDLGWDEEAP